MILYLCNGKAPCRFEARTECSYVNPGDPECGFCKHTTREEYAKNPLVENPRDNPRFEMIEYKDHGKVIYTEYIEKEEE